MKKKSLLITAMVACLSLATMFTSFAGEWKQDTTGWWYQEDDSSYPTNQWKEIDGKQYYFGADGYMLSNTTTPDGYKVGADGAWTEGVQNSQYQLKDFSALFFTDLKYRDNLAVHLGFTKEDVDFLVENSKGWANDFDLSGRTMYSGCYFCFSKSFSSGTCEVSNELNYIRCVPQDIITGLENKTYKAGELGDIVKLAGATDVVVKEGISKVENGGVNSDGSLNFHTGTYTEHYYGDLRFSYKGLYYSYCIMRGSTSSGDIHIRSTKPYPLTH